MIRRGLARSVFRTQSNIKDRDFCENFSQNSSIVGVRLGFKSTYVGVLTTKVFPNVVMRILGKKEEKQALNRK